MPLSLEQVNQRIREVYILNVPWWKEPGISEQKRELGASLGALLKGCLKRPSFIETPADDVRFYEAACALTKGLPANRHRFVAAPIERLGEAFWIGLRVCQFMPAVEARWYRRFIIEQNFSSQRGDLLEAPPTPVAQATAPLLQPLFKLLRDHGHQIVPCSVTDQMVEPDVPDIGYDDDYREIRRYLFPLFPD